MVHIEILLFVLGTFFDMQDARIAAKKTLVSLFLDTQEIEIVHKGLFAAIQSEEDVSLALKQWKDLTHWEEKEIVWADDLNVFPLKTLTFASNDANFQSKLKFRYSDVKDLQVLGIDYNKEKHQFFIHHIPQMNLKTNDGNLEGNYWIFNVDNNFSYSLEPFLDMPKELQQPIKVLLEKE